MNDVLSGLLHYILILYFHIFDYCIPDKRNFSMPNSKGHALVHEL